MASQGWAVKVFLTVKYLQDRTQAKNSKSLFPCLIKYRQVSGNRSRWEEMKSNNGAGSTLNSDVNANQYLFDYKKPAKELF